MKFENAGAFYRLLWDFKMSMHGYTLEAVILFVALTVFFYIVLNFERKKSISAIILAALFAFFQVFGFSFKKTASWDLIFGGARVFAKASVAFIGYAILFYFAICGAFVLFRKIKWIKEDTNVQSWFSDNRKSLFIVALIILLMWLPYFIAQFPGLTSYDFFDMLDTFYGKNTNSLRIVVPIDPKVTLNNNNPVCQTLLAVGVVKLGNMLGSPYIGLVIFVTVQAVIFALILSHSIRFLARKGIAKWVRIVILLMYGLIPIHANFAGSTLKDTNFAFMMLLYTLMVIDLVLDPEKYVSNKKNLIKIAVVMFIIMILRNNGMHVLAITSVILLIAFRKYFKRLVIPLIVPIVVFLMITNILYPALKISPGSEIEMYSIPFQQVARTVKEHGDEFTEKDKQIIDKVIKYDVLAERYNPELSDPVKSTYRINPKLRQKPSKKDLKDYLGVWFKYLKKYPDVYTQATMSNYYGYFYPQAQNWLVYYEIAKTGEPYGLKNIEKTETIRREATSIAYIFREIPGLGMLESLGFYIWGLFLVIAALFRYRKKKMILMTIPMLAVLLTIIAGPANTMVRYVYPIILTVPIFIVITGYAINKDESAKEE